MAISKEIRKKIMDCYFRRDRAELLLEEIGYPPYRFPSGDGEIFWRQVFREIDNGILPDQGQALVDLYAEQYPNSTVFSQGPSASPLQRPRQGASLTVDDVHNFPGTIALSQKGKIGDQKPDPTLLFMASGPHLQFTFDKHYQMLVDLPGLPKPIPALNTFVEDLTDILAHHRPMILHFSGHADRDRGTEFQTRSGDILAVGAQAWHNLVMGLNGNETLRLIVFNACNSENLASETAVACGAAIGYEGPVNEDESIVFARNFYTSLVRGETLAKAFDLARTQLQVQGYQLAAVALRFYTGGNRQTGEFRPFQNGR